MFRVRFNDEHTDGYAPAQTVEKVSAQLSKLLKRQRMVFSHTDDLGFAYFVPGQSKPKVRRAAKACPNCGYKAACEVQS